MAAREDARHAWAVWCRKTARRPRLKLFAEYMVEQIEPRVQRDRVHVAHIAPGVLAQAREQVANLSDREVREVILALRDSWYLGHSLRNWASLHTTLLNRFD